MFKITKQICNTVEFWTFVSSFQKNTAALPGGMLWELSDAALVV